jgi:cobalt/nickel transport protein
MRRAFSRRYLAAWALAAVACGVLLLVFASPWASKSPDGVEKVAQDSGLKTSDNAAAPAGGYKVSGVKSEATSRRLSALIGVAVTLVAAIGVGLLMTTMGKRRKGTGGDQGPRAGSGIEGGSADEA